MRNYTAEISSGWKWLRDL